MNCIVLVYITTSQGPLPLLTETEQPEDLLSFILKAGTHSATSQKFNAKRRLHYSKPFTSTFLNSNATSPHGLADAAEGSNTTKSKTLAEHYKISIKLKASLNSPHFALTRSLLSLQRILSCSFIARSQDEDSMLTIRASRW